MLCIRTAGITITGNDATQEYNLQDDAVLHRTAQAYKQTIRQLDRNADQPEAQTDLLGVGMFSCTKQCHCQGSLGDKETWENIYIFFSSGFKVLR